jgi:hypothetical protein
LDFESRAREASVVKERHHHPAVQLFVIAESWVQKFNISVKCSGLEETKGLT